MLKWYFLSLTSGRINQEKKLRKSRQKGRLTVTLGAYICKAQKSSLEKVELVKVKEKKYGVKNQNLKKIDEGQS